MKTKTPYPIILLTTLFFLSCAKKLKTSDEGYYFMDFDNLKMWSHDEQITNEKAHSGNYSIYTDSIYEFSQAFEFDFKIAKAKGYNYMNVKGWALIPNGNEEASLVASIETHDKVFAYQKTDFINVIIAPDKWVAVSVFLKFPDNPAENSKIKVYCWSPKKDKSFLDDVEIQFGK